MLAAYAYGFILLMHGWAPRPCATIFPNGHYCGEVLRSPQYGEGCYTVLGEHGAAFSIHCPKPVLVCHYVQVRAVPDGEWTLTEQCQMEGEVNITKNEALAGLKAGKRLRCDRKDAPLLPWLLDQVDAGILTSEYIEHDEQSSCIEFRWAGQRGKDEAEQ